MYDLYVEFSVQESDFGGSPAPHPVAGGGHAEEEGSHRTRSDSGTDDAEVQFDTGVPVSSNQSQGL